jgi:flagellar hook-length control protein FliK
MPPGILINGAVALANGSSGLAPAAPGPPGNTAFDGLLAGPSEEPPALGPPPPRAVQALPLPGGVPAARADSRPASLATSRQPADAAASAAKGVAPPNAASADHADQPSGLQQPAAVPTSPDPTQPQLNATPLAPMPRETQAGGEHQPPHEQAASVASQPGDKPRAAAAETGRNKPEDQLHPQSSDLSQPATDPGVPPQIAGGDAAPPPPPPAQPTQPSSVSQTTSLSPRPQPVVGFHAASTAAPEHVQAMPGAVSVDNGDSRQASPVDPSVAPSGTVIAASSQPSTPTSAVAPVKSDPGPPQIAANAAETVTTRVVRAVQDGSHVVTMELHPAELGRVEVRLSFHEGAVGVQMTLDRPETYDAFMRDRGVMEQHLADAGINLASGGLDMRFGQQPDRPAPQPPAQTINVPVPQGDSGTGSRSAAQSRLNGLIDILA